MIALAPMADPFNDVWITGPGGLPTPTMISWYHLTAGKVLQNMDAIDWDRLNWHLPLLTMDEAAGRPNPRWRTILAHSVLDEWWEPMRYQQKFDQVQVPVLHICGWYDPLGTSARLEVADQVIHHDAERPSYVLIPIVPADPPRGKAIAGGPRTP